MKLLNLHPERFSGWKLLKRFVNNFSEGSLFMKLIFFGKNLKMKMSSSFAEIF